MLASVSSGRACPMACPMASTADSQAGKLMKKRRKNLEFTSMEDLFRHMPDILTVRNDHQLGDMCTVLPASANVYADPSSPLDEAFGSNNMTVSSNNMTVARLLVPFARECDQGRGLVMSSPAVQTPHAWHRVRACACATFAPTPSPKFLSLCGKPPEGQPPPPIPRSNRKVLGRKKKSNFGESPKGP